MLRNHGQRPKYHHYLVGGNFRMDALQGAVLQAKFKYLEGWTEARRNHAARYNSLFADHNLAIPLHEFDLRNGIVLPTDSGFGRNIYHLYIIRTKFRDDLATFLKEHGISCEIYYPIPLHLQECFTGMGYKTGDFPDSEKAAKETLALPVYPELTDDQLIRVVETISEFFNHHVN
jgi:dTDP-4-amino-4,6-dideoxygalactose transaminase